MKGNLSAYDRTLDAWAKETRAKLDESTRKLIRLANYDLYFGPVGDGAYGDPAFDADGNENEWAGYPGFAKACDKIADALDDRELVPSTLYLDTDAEGWTDREPEADKCDKCDGTGRDEEASCMLCDGQGSFEPGGWWAKVERRDLVRALVGTLSEYL